MSAEERHGRRWLRRHASSWGRAGLPRALSVAAVAAAISHGESGR
jgi:hypothetical protein